MAQGLLQYIAPYGPLSTIFFLLCHYRSDVVCLKNFKIQAETCEVPAAERWATEIWTVPAAVGFQQTRGYSSKPGRQRETDSKSNVYSTLGYATYTKFIFNKACIKVLPVVSNKTLNNRNKSLSYAALGLLFSRYCLLEQISQSRVVYSF